MAIKSLYAGKCKDCGVAYGVGEEIDKNGKESLNQKGEMKPHWCKNGTNCQGVMQLESKSFITQDTTGRMTGPISSQDPTTAELRAKFDELDVLQQQEPKYAIIGEYIEQREACEEFGITHPATTGMIWNNRVRGRV